MFPWNQNLWLYASANNYKPGTSTLYTHHRSGYVDFVNRVPKLDSTSSSNPLLIVQKTSDTPVAATERYTVMDKSSSPSVTVILPKNLVNKSCP